MKRMEKVYRRADPLGELNPMEFDKVDKDLRDRLRSEDSVERQTAVSQLKGMGSKALPILETMLVGEGRDRKERVREAAAYMVGEIGVSDSEAAAEAKRILNQASRWENRWLRDSGKRLKPELSEQEYQERMETLTERRDFVKKTITESLKKIRERK